ncbi:MAG: anhydro-N-acetylmuramic acid kinase [Parvibaculales bacterium]
MEALCFAWLGVRRVKNLPTSLPSTTGASKAVCGGDIFPAP